MTQLLQQAFDQISQFPIEIQNQIAEKLLKDIEPMQQNTALSQDDPLWLLGETIVIEDEPTDASTNHDNYIYQK